MTMTTSVQPQVSQMQCVNPQCRSEATPLGKRVCGQCGAPLTYRYLWAVGEGVADITAGTRVGDRYHVVAPQVWLDTRPNQAPEVPDEIPEPLLPYLKLFAYRLHVPTIYSFAVHESQGVLLLDQSPLDAAGNLFPAIAPSLSAVPAVRQAYWLWQLLDLWLPLAELKVASSLLTPDNIRVEGWRVRLRSLFQDSTPAPSLADLADVWEDWIPTLHPSLQPAVRGWCERMRTNTQTGVAPAETLRAIAYPLNQLLLQQAAAHPLRLSTASATSVGPKRSLNEDTCYPDPSETEDPFLLRPLAVVCDGIGGHAGGEVASQMAVRSLQLQIRALLIEVAEQSELWSPDIVAQQIEAIVRVVNNLIAAQNDQQEREARDRMGTTLVLALQLPQKATPPDDAPPDNEPLPPNTANTHELYLVHVGDSRAYWVTPRYCHLLTVDDDVAGREVQQGRSLYHQALRRPDGGALTQALGTRDAGSIYPTLQRFILEEDGILLLCSDGVSNYDLVEHHWESVFRPLFKGKATLAETANRWVALADEKNGRDNASVVLMQCQVSREQPHLFDPNQAPSSEKAVDLPEAELSESSRALLYDVTPPPPRPEKTPAPAPRATTYWNQVVALLLAMFVLGLGSTLLWRIVNPTGFEQFWNQPTPDEQN